jgi:formiminotetrahydrofolate cyclodeaminase
MSPTAPDDPLSDWMTAIAAPTASPAGGSAAAIAGAMAAALAEMVAGLTRGREKYQAVHAEAGDVVARAERLRRRLAALGARDAEVFLTFTAALALPSGTPPEKAARDRAKDDALRAGAAVQLELLEGLADAASLAEAMAERGLASALGDAATGVLLAAGAARSAYWAVRSNLQGTRDRAAGERDIRQAKVLLDRIEETERRVLRLLEQRVP